MNRAEFDCSFDEYWETIRARFDSGEDVIYRPVTGNPRKIFKMEKARADLRETTERKGVSTVHKGILRQDFWKLLSDPDLGRASIETLEQRHDIKNFSEFKRDMFNEFTRQVGLAISLVHSVRP